MDSIARSRNASESEPVPDTDDPGSQRFYHGSRADLKRGDLIGPGYASNFGTGKKAKFVYLTATLDAATWGAELASGEGPGRIYTVEPTGEIEDDPNLTDKKFPGNPTKSYRTAEPLLVTGEVPEWQGHSPEMLQAMNRRLIWARRSRSPRPRNQAAAGLPEPATGAAPQQAIAPSAPHCRVG